MKGMDEMLKIFKITHKDQTDYISYIGYTSGSLEFNIRHYPKNNNISIELDSVIFAGMNKREILNDLQDLATLF